MEFNSGFKGLTRISTRTVGKVMTCDLMTRKVMKCKVMTFEAITYDIMTCKLCWPVVPKFAGSNPSETVGFLRAKKSSARLPSEGEVKPSVPCRRFAACKRSLELRGIRILGEIFRNISRPRRVPPSAARGLSRRWT